ncbi:GntR family transcriptional regulator [Photobacterium profundum]|uniref:GntR family transcriptional regulator n=1 Tax=Photobacterium profundum TaxID=74109 RepID=UPI003D136D79
MVYKQIAKLIRERINSDEFEIGDYLSSEIKLANEYNVSRMTLRKALNIISQSGLILRHHGKGTVVTNKDVKYSSNHLQTFSEYLHGSEQCLRSEVIEFSLMPAPLSIAQKLKIKVNTMLYHVIRVRSLNDQPIQIEESYLPAVLFPDLCIQYLEGSKFQYVETVVGMRIKGCTETFTSVMPSQRHKKLLKMSNSSPLLQITSLNENEDGQYFDLSLIHVNAQQYPMTYYFQRR